MNIRPAEEGDVPGIVDLLNAVFPRHHRSRAHWDWSHRDARGISVVAEHDGDIVGHYSFGLRRLAFGGREVLAGFGQQAAVHPRHRDMRTIVELIRSAESLAAESCGFVFAFPNEHMALIKERVLGWRRLLVFPTWSASLDALKSELRPTGDCARLTCMDGLSADCDSRFLSQVRDADWYRWRYRDNPMSHYAVYSAGTDGFAVLKTHHDGASMLGHVIELYAPTDDARRTLLSAAVRHFEFADVEKVAIWNQCPANRPLFQDLGFEPGGPWTGLYARRLDDSIAEDAEWDFDMGTSDVF